MLNVPLILGDRKWGEVWCRLSSADMLPKILLSTARGGKEIMSIDRQDFSVYWQEWFFFWVHFYCLIMEVLFFLLSIDGNISHPPSHTCFFLLFGRHKIIGYSGFWGQSLSPILNFFSKSNNKCLVTYLHPCLFQFQPFIVYLILCHFLSLKKPTK